MKKLFENWRRFIIKEEEGPEMGGAIPKIHFQNWLIDKTKRVHSEPGQGSIFKSSIEEVVNMVKEIAANARDVDEIANTTGVLSKNVKGIGYDLVVPVIDGQPMHKGKPLQGTITKTTKEEGRGTIEVDAIITDEPLESFKTDKLSVIIRPMKDADGNKIPNEYIILSAFPGSTGADKVASEWSGSYMVVIPKAS